MITPLEDEWREIARIYYAAIHHAASRWYTPSQIDAGLPDLSQFDGWQTSLQDGRFFLYRVDDQVVGFIGVFSDGRLEGPYGDSFFLRRGTAQALIDHVTAIARDESLPVLTAVTGDPFVRTVLRHSGFTILRSQPLSMGALLIPGTEVSKPLCGQVALRA